MAPPKKPRRTAERILEAALALFNRYGEPNVSTTVISAELGISPGNLTYHYRTKGDLIDGLVGRFEAALMPILGSADGVQDVEDAWLLFHMLFEAIWDYRFLYRDLNDLLSKNRRLETQFRTFLDEKDRAMHAMLAGMSRQGVLRLSLEEAAPAATSMVVVLSYWLSFETVRDPRWALEPENAAQAMGRGAFHALALLQPHLDDASRAHLRHLSAAYLVR